MDLVIRTTQLPPPPNHGYFRKIFSGTLSLFKGLAVTMGYFVRPSRIVTEQYPENRATLKMTPRFRGSLEMIHDEEGKHNCTACMMCEKACPNGSISVLSTKSLANKKILGKHVWRMDSCTFCNLCVEVCPTDALRMSQEFETATTDRDAMVRVLNKSEGRW